MSGVPHLGFIVAAYAVAAVTIAAMIAAILWDYRDLRARLARLDGEREGPR
jgi:heme exporter protein CcmD